MTDPVDACSWFANADHLDQMDQERSALEAYRQVERHGIDTLPEEDRPRFYLQIGSTLRNCNDLPESRRYLNEGITRYPNYQALKVFLALTEWSDGNKTRAFSSLLALLSQNQESSLAFYGRAIHDYAKDLCAKDEKR